MCVVCVKGVLQRVANEVVQRGEEVRVNFASAQDIVGIARDAAGLIIAHPLQIMRIVPASFKASGVPGPKALALCAKHLVAALGLVNGNLAIWAGFSVVLQKSDRRNGVGVANVKRVIACSLEFPAMSARVFVASGTFPSGRDEAVAAGISAAVNELFSLVCMRGALTLQLILGVPNQISFESLKLIDLRLYVLDLVLNALEEAVMCDGGLCGR